MSTGGYRGYYDATETADDEKGDAKDTDLDEPEEADEDQKALAAIYQESRVATMHLEYLIEFASDRTGLSAKDIHRLVVSVFQVLTLKGFRGGIPCRFLDIRHTSEPFGSCRIYRMAHKVVRQQSAPVPHRIRTARRGIL